MATIEDAMLSIRVNFNTIATSLGLILVIADSDESLVAEGRRQEDSLVAVQADIDAKVFTTLKYNLFVSYANTSDINSLKETEQISAIIAALKPFSKICIYEATGLKQSPSVFTDTGVRLAIMKSGRSLGSRPKIRGNLNSIDVVFSGVLQ